MILLLNTTKTMDMSVSIPSGLKVTEPRQMEMTHLLAKKISRLNTSQLVKQMSLSEKLAAKTKENATLWGTVGRPKAPGLFCFTGLLYKNIDVFSFEKSHLRDAQKTIRILSGLYGILRPFDRIEAYRLEMGHKLAVGTTKSMAAFWKETLTAKLNEDLKTSEPVISVAAKEYMKALNLKALNGPVISPVFKEYCTDGTLKTVVVNAKKARGALIRYSVLNKAQTPRDLMGFNEMGWKAVEEPPEEGPWLFTRPAAS